MAVIPTPIKPGAKKMCDDCPALESVDGKTSLRILKDHMTEEHKVTHIGQDLDYDQLDRIHQSLHQEEAN